MKMQEKCIYYNKNWDEYYLVLSISDMIYGRRGNMINLSYSDPYMSQVDGLKFKIDNIIINRDWIYNYYIDENFDEFEFVRKLTNEEFDSIYLLIRSDYLFPPVIIDITDVKSVSKIVKTLKNMHVNVDKLREKISTLEKKLFNMMR